MNVKLIGRKKEQEILNKALNSPEAELISVIGRRRVGKTFLVKKTFEGKIEFDIIGIQNGTLEEQLQNFTNRLNTYAKQTIPISAPTNWLAAFQILIDFLEEKINKKKIVLFFDELPWMATRKSGFIKAFGFFWNSWASQKNIVVVICGSAASWMINKVVKDRGGLHNRITRRINLEPFNLAETEKYFKSRKIRLDRYQILQLYMAMGGVPHYLKEVEGGKSATQNIDTICFSKDGILKDEFTLLYPALFNNPEDHIKIIKALSTTRQGLTRQELIKKSKLTDNGKTSKLIEDLLISGFINSYYTFGKKKRAFRYRLTDEYSLFYLKFIEDKRSEGKGTWEKLSETQTWKSWSGYTFESIALKHIPQIKKALEISGIYSEASTYLSKGSDKTPGFQIDLLIDRNDQTINLCELKFYKDNYIITKDYAAKLRQKRSLFKHVTKTKKLILITLISTFPIIKNQHSLGIIDRSITMDDLFVEV